MNGLVIALVGAALADWPAAIDADRVAIVRNGTVELYDRAGTRVSAFPAASDVVVGVWLDGDRVLASVSTGRFRVWDGGRFVASGLGWLSFVDDDGTAWSVAGAAAYSFFAEGGRAAWSLPPRTATSDHPALPPQAPAALPLLSERPSCRLVGRERAVCPGPGGTTLLDASGAELARVDGDLLAAGPAGFVAEATGRLRETRVYAADGTLVHTAPFTARGAGVGDDAFVLLERAESDRAWIVPLAGEPTSWPLGPEPERSWTIALPGPTVRVEANGGVAWLAVDDLAVVAAVPIDASRSPAITPVPDGVRLHANTPRPDELRRFNDDRWLFQVAGKTAWELPLAGTPGPLVEAAAGRVLVFFPADGTIRGFDAATGKARWTARVALERPKARGADRLLVTGTSGWALLDTWTGTLVASGTVRVRDADAFPAAFTDDEGDVRGPDGRVLTRVPPKGRALGVLADGGVVCAEGGAVVVRDGERVRWWQAPDPTVGSLPTLAVVGDAVWLGGNDVIVRLDGGTGAVTGAVPWTFGRVVRFR